jgi:hypothetical protein
VVLYGVETWTLRKVDQKYLESFEIWCRRMMEKISWTDRVRNVEALHRVKEERNIRREKEKRNILHAIKIERLYEKATYCVGIVF